MLVKSNNKLPTPAAAVPYFNILGCRAIHWPPLFVFNDTLQTNFPILNTTGAILIAVLIPDITTISPGLQPQVYLLYHP